MRTPKLWEKVKDENMKEKASEIRKEYSILFNGITETIDHLENTISSLKKLQQRAEDAYIEEEQEENIVPFTTSKGA